MLADIDHGHPEDQNLHCLDSILQMLNYCSEIRLMIMNTNEPICEEVSRIFKRESLSSTSLRLILRSLDEEASYLYHQNQDILKVLKIVLRSIENEISQPMIQCKEFNREEAKQSVSLLLYTKNTEEKSKIMKQEFHCNIDGCPLEEKLSSNEALKEHMEFEHPTCNVCKEVFLLNCLYKEHTKYKYCELTQPSSNNNQSECKKEKQTKEEEFRSKDVTRKRKYTCIEVASNLTNEVQISIKRQKKVKKEGINDLKLNISFDENVTKIKMQV